MSGAEISRLVPPGQRVLLKIDVEGCEATVLTSLQRFIACERPDIVIEVLSQTADALNRMDVLRSYRFYQLDSDGPRERDSFVVGANRDYALVPIERDGTLSIDAKAGVAQ